MPRREEILSNMRVYLQNQDPQWDLSPGTPEFKILEAVAQQLENVSFDGLLSTYHFDLDKKAGAELDLFLSLFGFYRQRSTRATGVIVLRRGSDAPNDLSIPIGTQVFVPASNGNPSIYFSTTASAIISMGTRQVAVPIEANIGGTTGNVSAYTITSFGSTANNVTEAYNPAPTSGGSDVESDDAFRERFKRTFLRNVAGTENQFAGVALAEPGVDKVSVISPVENYREQIQLYPIVDQATQYPYEIDSSTDLTQVTNLPKLADGSSFLIASFTSDPILGDQFIDLHKVNVSVSNDVYTYTVDSSNPLPSSYDKLLVAYESEVNDARYVFPAGSEIVGVNIGTTSEIFAIPNSFDANLSISDYVMLTSSSASDNQLIDINYPVFVFSSNGAIRLGGPETVVTIQFEYTPIASRNEPPMTMNKMDLFISGIEENNISEQIYMINNSNSEFLLNGTSPNINSIDFVRQDGITSPKDYNIFTGLNKTPIISIPDSIMVDRFVALNPDDRDNPKYNLDESQIYYKDEDYWLVRKKTNNSVYNVYSGTRRSVEGIEWNTPLQGSLLQTGANDTYVKPIKTSSDLSAPFNVYQTAYTGKLNGYYAYVFTWEADGKESIASAPKSLLSKVSNKQVLFNFNSAASQLGSTYASIIGFDENSGANFRKIYRSKAAANSSEAEQGPFYLVKVIKNNDANVYWIDNTADDDLGFTTPPKAPPPHGAPLDFVYTYNSLIQRIDNRMNSVRLVGQDIMTHQASYIPIKFNFAVVPSFNTSYNSVKAGVASALQRFLSAKPFGSNLQIADLIAAVETASEVDNVRLLNDSEASDESLEIKLSSPDTLTNTDTMIISVDGYTTSSLTADEHGYVVREALEALPVFDSGDTYASFLVSSMKIAGADGAELDDTQLSVWNNSNAQRIVDIFNDPNRTGEVYLQVTQMGNVNLDKDEIVKITSISDQSNTDPVYKTFDIIDVSVNGTTVTFTTSIQGLDVGATIDVYDASNNSLSQGEELTAVTANSVTFTSNVNFSTASYFKSQISSGTIVFDVARGQLGSNKYNYGDGTDSPYNDVLRAGSEAWIHLLGDVAVAKNTSSGGKEITFTISLLNNVFTKVNNWGKRSMFNFNNNYRFNVEPGGNISSSIIRKVLGSGAGVEILAENLKTIKNLEGNGRFIDIYFASNELPMFAGLDLVLKAQNTFD